MAKVFHRENTKNRDAWIEARKGKIGSSDIATICGLNKYKSALELWAEWTGKIESENDNPAAKYGRMVEGAIAELFQDKFEDEFLVECPDCSYVHDEHEWAMATPDRIITALHHIDEPFFIHAHDKGVLEIKHTSVAKEWDDGGAPDYAQTQEIWQMGILGLNYGYIAAVVQGRANDLKAVPFEFSPEFFAALIESGQQFLDMVKQDIPPQAGAGDSKLIEKLTTREEGKACNIQYSEWFEKYDEANGMILTANEELSAWKDKKKEAENNIKKQLGDCTLGLLPDGAYVQLKTVNRKGYAVDPCTYTQLSIKGAEANGKE